MQHRETQKGRNIDKGLLRTGCWGGGLFGHKREEGGSWRKLHND
jgi:hypothetical protein